MGEFFASLTPYLPVIAAALVGVALSLRLLLSSSDDEVSNTEDLLPPEFVPEPEPEPEPFEPEPNDEPESASKDAAYNARRQQVIDVLSSDDLLATELLERTGHAGMSKYTAMKSEEVLAVIVRATASNYILDILHIAGTQTDIDFHKISSEDSYDVGMEVSPWPTNYLDFRPISSYKELGKISPRDLALDDDLFYSKLLNNNFLIREYYDGGKKSQRILVVLIDASGSMDENFRGQPRHIWARGVLINLLLAALHEDVRYIVRYFTKVPSERIYVDSVDVAKEMISEVIENGYAEGGTSITAALTAAVKDIAELREKLPGVADIFLISDGDDNIRAATIRKILGDDIRLHAACIALQNPNLRAAATTYYEIR